MTKSKKTYFRAFFAQIWTKITFPGKKALSVFKYSNYLPSCQKSEKTDVIPEENAELTDGWTNRRKDRQTTMILQDPLQDGRPIIKVTLSFPEFILKQQKPVYCINFFARYSQFQISAITVGTPIYDHAHPSIFQPTFNFNEFVSTCKKSGFFIFLFQKYILFKHPAI